MAKSKPGGFYAVKVGRRPGIYTTWPDAQEQVEGFQGAKHKKFPTRQEAEAFLSAKPPVPLGQTTLRNTFTHTRNNGGVKRIASALGEGGSRKGGMSHENGSPAKRQKKEVQARSKVVVDENVRKVYCDGSCLNNGKPNARAGCGIFWGDNDDRNMAERVPGPVQTNNRGEMYAILRILETDATPELPLVICSDSQYTIDVFSQYIHKWRLNQWRTAEGQPAKNRDMIEYISGLLTLRLSSASSPLSSKEAPLANVTFQKVKAHTTIYGNNMADELAKQGAMEPMVPERNYGAELKKLEAEMKKKDLLKVKDNFGIIVSAEDAYVDETMLMSEAELKELEGKF